MLPRPLVPIACALLTACVLGVARVHGSSVAIYDDIVGDPTTRDGVLHGTPRHIRSDEWLVRTPWVLRQMENGFDRYVAGGVGRHDVGLIGDLPVLSWEILLRPHHLPYFLFPPEIALAMEWWVLHAIQFVGVYLLLYVLTRRIHISALCAALVTLSPATQWWSVSFTYLTIGYACIAGSFAVLSLRNQIRKRQIAYGSIAAVSLGAFVATLYPPWQIPVGLIVLATCLAAAARDCSFARRSDWIRLGITLATIIGIAGVLSLAFLLQHRGAVEAINSTVYPGARDAERGGTASATQLLGGAFDSFASRPENATANGTNTSENASGLFLLAPVGLAAIGLFNSVRVRRAHFPLLALLAVGALLTAWMLLPLSTGVGSFFLLNRVPSKRLLLPMILLGALAFGVLLSLITEERRRLNTLSVALAVAIFAGAQFWAAGAYTVDGQTISTVGAAVLVLVVSGGVGAALMGRTRLGLGALVALTAWQATMINPLQIGIPELLDGDLRQEIDAIDSTLPEGAGWISFINSSLVRGTLTASGVNTLSAISPYPDAEAFEILDPSGTYIDIWNRYASVFFAPAEAGADPSMTLVQADAIVVIVDPCDPRLDDLNVNVIISGQPLDHECLHLASTVVNEEATLSLYRRSSP